MPHGLTLLFTDVVDSTQTNTRVGDAEMSRLWADHDRQSRALMQLWRAREIGRSDGFLLLFEEPCDALGFAHDYHRELERLHIPVRARVGMHTGPVELRKNSDHDVARGAPLYEVDGLALPLAARLQSAASAGQTLLSSVCRRALEPHLQSEALQIEMPQAPATPDQLHLAGHPSAEPILLRLVDQGHWRFKGIDTPVHVFQAATEHDDVTPPLDSPKAYRVLLIGTDWLPAREIAHNLPAERDRFVGRSGDLRLIERCFDDGARLVSLLGMGGIGKTRLSLRYARRWLGDYAGGAWFCDLSAALGLDGIVYTTAQALGIALDSSDPVQLIGAAIAGRGPCLVILDNFEQVAQHAEEALGAWLRAAPQARFIVTTREVLGIVGEHALMLEPLAPAEAEELLRERMSAAGFGAALTASDAAAIGPLVDMLDRLPLAIELAAARARVMAPTELLARMGERFKLLVTRCGRPDRQATLRVTLDWSWERLTSAERQALAQCSVFEGGFTLVAAEAVLDLTDGKRRTWAADAVQSLVEKSLLRQGSNYRFEMLRSVHDYASERLAASGQAAHRAALARHWRHFASLSEQAAIAGRCIETENLVAACRRAIDAEDLDTAADALLVAWAALNLTGPFKVAVEMAQELYHAAHPQAMQAAMTARWVRGSARYLAGDVAAAQADLEAAMWPGGSLALRARALGGLGQLERSLGHFERADEMLRIGLDAAVQTGDSGLICRAYNALGTLRLAQGRLDAALGEFTVGLEAAVAARDLKQQAALLGNIGVVQRKRGRDELALNHYRDALALAQQIGDRRFEGNMRSNIGLFLFQSGDNDGALEELRSALDIAHGAGLTRLSANVCCNLGLVQEALGDCDGALNRHRRAVEVAAALEDAQLGGQFRMYLGRLLVRLKRAREAQLELDASEALLVDCADGNVLGLLACARVEWAVAVGDAESSQYWLEAAAYRVKQTICTPGSELGREFFAAQATVKPC